MGKEAGILMPVSALPGRHGIGDFGSSSYEFVDQIAQAGLKIWQILPLGPLGYGNSPYQPYSSFAGDELYISLDRLWQEGLLGKTPSFEKFSTSVDYQAVREFKSDWLKKAYRKFRPNEEYEAFVKQEWVRSYAIYLTFKKANELRSWLEWPKKQKEYWKKPFDLEEAGFEESVQYEMFVQYEFYHQWMTLKAYANQKGVQIMGDIPFYVGIDSLDVWANQDCFLLDKAGNPKWIAGVPPDYFSETGQRWGNPIYNWKHLKETGFEFWISRLAYTAKLFDIIRIDHFRAFDTYWRIPSSCPTAIEGKWMLAPGYEFFDTLFEQYPDIHIIVEDLGFLTPSVLKLVKDSGFPGMKVLQFAFDPREESDYLPHNYQSHSVVYTGTHDNDTVMGWMRTAPKDSVKFAKKYLNLTHKEGYNWGMMRGAWASVSDLAVVPMQDILGLGNEARMNTPSTLGCNWKWRMKHKMVTKRLAHKIAKYMKMYGRG